jgi:HK97 family phage portal protein
MGIVDEVRGAFSGAGRLLGGRSRKANPNQSFYVSSFGGSPIWTTIKYEALAREAFNGNVYAHKGIQQIGISIASIEWFVAREEHTPDGETDIHELDRHPLKDILKRPNPQQGWPAFIENVIQDLYIGGNVYILKVCDPDTNYPVELYCLRPDRVRIVPGNKQNPIAGYIFTATGTNSAFYPQTSVLHIKYRNPIDDFYGMSPLMVAIYPIDMNNEIRKFNMGLLQNGARPSMLVSTEQEVDPEEIQRITALLYSKYGGTANAGKFIVLDKDFHVDRLSLSPVDMDWHALATMTAKEVGIALGVPPERLGDNANKTYSNYQEANRAFYTDTIIPLVEYFKGEFNNWLSTVYPDHAYIDIKRDRIIALIEEEKMRVELANMKLGSGAYSINEWRKDMGKKAITDISTMNPADIPLGVLQIAQIQAMLGMGAGGGMGGMGMGGMGAPGAAGGLEALMGAGGEAAASGEEPAPGEPIKAEVVKPKTPKDVMSAILGEASGKPAQEFTAYGLPPKGLEDDDDHDE